MNKLYNLNSPWIEKYRPTHFNDIIMDPINKKIIEAMLNKDYFPNILLYGPPGTGKTTTIINLIHNFQKKHNQLNKGLIIHLNASDERGIDIIRNQINQFVNSNSLFINGIKFVILDEIDYMTKTAQYALRYLLQSFNKNVRFCLICNYISRIDESLQNEVMRIRFNNLPQNEIIQFLNVINEKEKINLTMKNLESIQEFYNSDVRSMLNYIQSNQYNISNNNNIICDKTWETFTAIIINSNNSNNSNNIIKFMEKLELEFNNEIKMILKKYFNYVIRKQPKYISKKLFSLIEFILHDPDINPTYIKKIVGLTIHDIFVTPLDI
jgi:replication factor C subunit 3/5